jgi:CBS domain-containing protein
MKNVAEIMNRSFFAATPMDRIGPLLHQMTVRGLRAVPVLDSRGRPLGEATAADIQACRDMEEVTERLTRPVLSMRQDTPVDVVARTLALHRQDSVLLIDDDGLVVGSLTALELLRATLGLNASRHPAQPMDHDACWEDTEYLELAAAHRAPEAPGIILISPGLDSSARRVVWAEPANDMRERLDEMLRNPQDDSRLEAMLDVYPRTLRFRCLTVFDAEQREKLAAALCTLARRENTSEPNPSPADPDLLAHASMGVGGPDRVADAG